MARPRPEPVQSVSLLPALQPSKPLGSDFWCRCRSMEMTRGASAGAHRLPPSCRRHAVAACASLSSLAQHEAWDLLLMHAGLIIGSCRSSLHWALGDRLSTGVWAGRRTRAPAAGQAGSRQSVLGSRMEGRKQQRTKVERRPAAAPGPAAHPVAVAARGGAPACQRKPGLTTDAWLPASAQPSAPWLRCQEL